MNSAFIAPFLGNGDIRGKRRGQIWSLNLESHWPPQLNNMGQEFWLLAEILRRKWNSYCFEILILTWHWHWLEMQKILRSKLRYCPGLAWEKVDGDDNADQPWEYRIENRSKVEISNLFTVTNSIEYRILNIKYHRY